MFSGSLQPTDTQDNSNTVIPEINAVFVIGSEKMTLMAHGCIIE